MHIRTAFQPCSIERRSGKPPGRPVRATPAMVTFAASLSFGASAVAVGSPTGGAVTQGQGTISTPASGQTLINQSSQQLQLNWSTFNVGANESVRFNQPSSTAIAFNHILDQNPSQIFGSVSANGQVVLVNPNGVLIGRTARLNVNSLVVSSLNAIDFDAASGRYRFSATRNDPGAVVNQGTITAGAGGSVTLLGGSVSNSGTIVADYGTVNLAAGRTATLDLAGDGLLRLEVGGDLVANHDGVASAVENSGSIEANGGHVLLTASAVKDVFQNLVNNSGVIRASRISNSGGTIELLGPGGTVVSSGTLDASAGDAVSTGGTVEVLGDRVGLTGNAVVDVSGATGGGTALVGGDTHGSNPDVLDASITYVSSGATLNADAGVRGDGGRVVVWSNQATSYGGGLSARGGTASGNGGFAEVSGKESLQFSGKANLTAPHGTWGMLLLDPADITINDSATTPGDWPGPTATNPNYAPNVSRTISAADIVSLLSTTNLTLTAEQDIIETPGLTGAGATIDASSGTAGDSLTLNAGRNISLSYPILTNNGAINLTAGTGNVTMLSGSSLDAGTAAVTVSAGSGATLSNILHAGTVNVTSGASTSPTGADNNLTLGSITSAGNVVLTADRGGSILEGATGVGAGIQITGGTGGVALTADADIGTVTNFASLAGTSVPVQGASSLTADVTGTAGGQINLLLSNSVLPANAIQFSGTNTAGGPVILQTQGSFDTTDTALYAANAVQVPGTGTTEVALVSQQGTLTVTDNLPDIISAAPATLLLSGVDVVSNGGTPHQLAVNLGSSGDLIFEASAPTSDVTLNTTVGNVSATLGTPHNLTVNNAGALSLDAASAGGTVTITTSGGGDLDVNGQVSAGPGVVLTSSGAITEGTSNSISGGSLAATGTAIGTQLAPLRTQVGSLQTTSTNGSTYLLQTTANTVQVAGSAIQGALHVEAAGSILATSAGGVGVLLQADGANGTLTVSNPINAGTGDLTLKASGSGGSIALNAPVTAQGITTIAAGVSGNGALTFANGVSADGSQLIVNAQSIGTGTGGSSLQTNAGTVNATATNGSIFITDTNTTSATLTAAATGGSVGVEAVAGALNVASVSGTGVSLDTNSNGHALTVSGPIDAKTGALSLTTNGSGSGIVVNGTLNADGGVSVGTSGSSTGITLNNTVTSQGLVAVTTSGANSDIDLNSSVNTSGNVNISAGPVPTQGAIVAGSGNSLTGSQITVSGAAIGSSGIRLATAAGTSLNATSSSGSIYIQQATSASVLASALGGSVNVATTNGTLDVLSATGNAVNLSVGGSSQSLKIDGTVDGEGGLVSLASAGAITINTPINTSSQVALNAAGAITAGVGDSITTSGGLSLTGASIGTSVAQPLATSVATLSATSTGNAFISNTGALTLTGSSGSGTLNVATTGALAVTSASGNQVTLQGASIGGNGGGPAITAAASLNVTSTGGGIDVQQTNGMNLTANAVGGPVNVTSTNGAMTVSSATGNGVNLIAGGAGHNLTVNGTLDGEGGAVVLTAGGGININTPITTASALTLDATGAVTTGAAGDLITASALAVNAASIGSSAGRLATSVASLDVTSNNGGIFITQSGDTSLQASATGGALDVETSIGSLNVLAAAGDGISLVANGAGKALTVNGALNGNNGDVTLEAAGDGGNVTLGGSVATSANVMIAAGSSNLNGTLTVANGASVTGNQVGISGTSIGTSGGPLALTANSLVAASSGGGIFVSNSKDLTLNATAAGGDLELTTAGNLTVAAASSTGNVSLSATGAIGANPGADVAGNIVTLQGSSIGANGVLNTAAAAVNATSTSGGIYVQQAGDLILSASATGGPVNVATTTGALTVLSASGDGVNLSSGAAGQNFNINGTVNGGAGAVVLTATGAGSSLTLSGALNAASDVTLSATGTGGAINLDAPINTTGGGGVALVASGANGAVNLNAAVGASGSATVSAVGAVTAGSGASITASSLQVTGASIGASGALSTAVSSLNATSTNGAIVINNTGALALAATASGGLLNISTTDALSVASAAGDHIVLTAGGALSDAGGSIQGNQVTLQAASIGTSNSPLTTVASSLSVTSTNGDIHVRQAGDLTLSANATGGEVDVATTNGSMAVTSANGSGIVLAAGGTSQNLSVNGYLDGGAGTVSLTSGGAINVDGAISTANTLTLTASGAITAGPGEQITASSLTATGASVGATGAPLVTTVASLDAVSSGGDVFANNSGPLALTAKATGGTVDVATSGALTVASALGDDVTLYASGSLVETAGGGIGGNHVNLLAASIGAGNSPLNVAATSLDATSTSGGIYVQQAGDLNLTANAVGGPVDVATTNGSLTVSSVSGTGVTLAAAGASQNLNVYGALDGVGGPVSLTASGAINFNSTVVTTGSIALDAGGAITAGVGEMLSASALTVSASSIGTASNALNTNVAALTTTSKNGGTYVNEATSVTLTASATGGPLSVQTANGALVVDAASAPTISLTSGGAGSGITLNGAVNAGTGDVTLSAGTTAAPGGIIAGAGNQVVAGTLTAQGASVGSSSGALNTAVGTLNATASSGDIDVSQQGDIKLASVQAGGNVSVGSSGNITVGTVTAHGNATLTAQSGTISGGGAANSQLSGNTVTLAARAIGAPSTLKGTNLNSSTRLNTDATHLVATSTAGGVYINQLTGLASANVHASGGKDGNIELLTTTGDLNIEAMNASGNLLLAAGGNIYALPGSGTITAQSAELRAGGADLNAGHIGTLGHPLVLQLNAGNTLRMFVPQTIDANDANSGPATLTSPGVDSTLSLFTSPNLLAVEDGFGQFTGLGETQFTSAAELLVRSIQNQTATVQTVVGLDWSSFDPNVSLFGKLDPSVCLPGDQRDEEPGAPAAADRCVAK